MTMIDFSPFELDKRRVRQSFHRAARTYEKTAILQKQIADEMLNRLEVIKVDPKAIVDVGCGTGYALRRMQKRYRKAMVIGVDIAPGMLLEAHRHRLWLRPQRLIVGDGERLPIKDRSVDMIFCNVTLQWCNLDEALREFARILVPEGLMMFSTFGPDTLKEIRQAWLQVDDNVHVHRFIDMHDIGDAMIRHHFEIPVVDVDYATLTYRDVKDALIDLKQLGSSNSAVGRFKGLVGKRRFNEFAQALNSKKNEEGLLECSYEIVYGHGWAPAQRFSRGEDGTVLVPVTEIRRKPK